MAFVLLHTLRKSSTVGEVDLMRADSILPMDHSRGWTKGHVTDSHPVAAARLASWKSPSASAAEELATARQTCWEAHVASERLARENQAWNTLARGTCEQERLATQVVIVEHGEGLA